MAKEKDPVPKEVLEEGFFHPKSWMLEGLFFIAFAVVVSLLFTGTLNMEEFWVWHAVALATAIAAGVPYFLRPRFSRLTCTIIAIPSIIVAELAFYWIAFPG